MPAKKPIRRNIKSYTYKRGGKIIKVPSHRRTYYVKPRKTPHFVSEIEKSNFELITSDLEYEVSKISPKRRIELGSKRILDVFLKKYGFGVSNSLYNKILDYLTENLEQINDVSHIYRSLMI